MPLKPLTDVCNFKWYVLNYDWNAKKVINFNIFQNWLVRDDVFHLVKKHVNSPDELPFDELVKEIRRTIRWQEWSRREYEISVGDAFETDINQFEKWDCAQQAEPNMEAIARECIYQYKQWLKEKTTKK